MSWDLKKLLKEIDDYFDNTPKEEIEKKLKEAGLKEIEPAAKSGAELI